MYILQNRNANIIVLTNTVYCILQHISVINIMVCVFNSDRMYFLQKIYEKIKVLAVIYITAYFCYQHNG